MQVCVGVAFARRWRSFFGQAGAAFKNETQVYGKCDAERLEDLLFELKMYLRMAEILL